MADVVPASMHHPAAAFAKVQQQHEPSSAASPNCSPAHGRACYPEYGHASGGVPRAEYYAAGQPPPLLPRDGAAAGPKQGDGSLRSTVLSRSFERTRSRSSSSALMPYNTAFAVPPPPPPPPRPNSSISSNAAATSAFADAAAAAAADAAADSDAAMAAAAASYGGIPTLEQVHAQLMAAAALKDAADGSLSAALELSSQLQSLAALHVSAPPPLLPATSSAHYTHHALCGAMSPANGTSTPARRTAIRKVRLAPEGQKVPMGPGQGREEALGEGRRKL
ncbi:hypothetical protein TSOC_013410 [Tetrabaena socialis]|uniref:Uncharacterized protein n=1 Tax=Tetrabaena socialis TaxID=47790 RepID=A0A2J7ZKF3_9CHLO|nr:hypothetical protein TSOC_013410 [Tetrabaena socialis]|eukprot:PNH00749.1 hypothetical protein TSOC_013410 [Tetrabaena socialis]